MSDEARMVTKKGGAAGRDEATVARYDAARQKICDRVLQLRARQQAKRVVLFSPMSLFPVSLFRKIDIDLAAAAVRSSTYSNGRNRH